MVRRRFQIHLSSALLLMFAAGTLLWANVRERLTILSYRPKTASQPDGCICSEYGWPVIALVIRGNVYTNEQIFFYPFDWKKMTTTVEWHVAKPEAFVDGAIAIALLFALGYGSEGWIRRSAAHKAPADAITNRN